MGNEYPYAHRLTVEWNKQLFNDDLLHKYGGIPSNGIKLPKCSGCRQYHHLLFQIDLRDKNLEHLLLIELRISIYHYLPKLRNL